MVENIMGKGENVGFQHFLLFPKMFLKGLPFRAIKTLDCVVKTCNRVGNHAGTVVNVCNHNFLFSITLFSKDFSLSGSEIKYAAK